MRFGFKKRGNASRKLGARKRLVLPAIERGTEAVGALAAVVIVKDEGRYIEEWLAFHRLVGCEHVYVYDNGSQDDTIEIVERFVREGFATLLRWPSFDVNTGPQIYAYAHALCTHGPRWRWMTFLDADEFLYPVEEATLTDVLKRYEDLPAIAIPWRMFGFSGHARRPDGPVIENFVMRAPFPPRPGDDELLKVKCIVDPTRVSRVFGVHMFDLSTGGRSAYNEKRQLVTYENYRDRSLLCDDILRINHYFTRSEEDLASKLSKGSAARPALDGVGAPGSLAAERRRKVARMIERETVEDRAIQRFLPQLEQALAEARQR